uniref:Uncharacterized protein n=1 Tax=Tanacetum cinerariifolium TaxID=118510 RepID=A0A6L2MU13_TANCI|nr:hypothetical protein [Tanacetum cinerariifolium]
MINLCTCTRGSTSTIRSSKRRGGTTVSCKNCGGKLTIDGKSSSTCLLSTVLELTSVINSDITWTKVSKGFRSSSRRPRTSNTIKDLEGLDMPVSESEKLGVSVLGCHFSEKAEHIPIKKRRFLFRASSPPHNSLDLSLEGRAISHKVSTSLPVISEEDTGTCERSSIDGKLDDKVGMKEDDFSGISILAAAACINSLGAEADHCEGSEIGSSVTKGAEVPKSVEINENNVKSKKLDCHTSTDHSIGAASSTLDNSLESAVIKMNQEPSIEKSPARDVKFDWDLNTIMDAWEEPSVSENDAANANVKSVEEMKNDYTKGDSKFNSERESGSTSKGGSNQNLPVEFKSLSLEEGKLKMGKHKPDGYAEIHEPLSLGFDSGQHAVVVKTDSMQDKHIDSPNNVIPVTRTLSVENPTHGIFSKWAVQRCQRSGGFGSTEAVNTQLTMDRSVPPGFGQCLNVHASKENSVGENNLKFSAATEQPIMSKHELSLTTATLMENGGHQSPTPKAEDEHRMKMELASNVVGMSGVVTKGTDLPQDPDRGGNKVVSQATFGAPPVAHSSVLVENQPAAMISFHEAAQSNAEVALDNAVVYRNSPSENRAGSGIDKLDDVSVGYDSQYEDGELRESHLHAWKRYEENEEGHESDMDTREDNFNFGTTDAHETSSQCVHEDSSRIKFTDFGFGREADLTSGVLLPEKLHSSDEVVSGSGPNEMISGQENNERGDNVQHAHQSDVWKMNVSGWDILPENQRISSDNFSRTRNFTARKFSYGEQKDGFDTEDVEMKGEGSRFYRRETLTRIGGPSMRDTFLSSRGRFRLQGCSSKVNDGFTSRPERESGQLRSFGRGRYSPHRPSGRGGGMWNRSPERNRDLKRLPSPSYQGPSFRRSMLDDAGSVEDMANECGMDTSDAGRPNTTSYVTRRVYRSRSPGNREANDFRARLGLRPTRDTGHERFVNVGRGRGMGRSVRYGTGTRLEGEGRRYHGPANDDCDEYITEYIPRRRRCISPIERRVNQSYPHHQSGSRSPPSRPRTRSPIANSGFRRRSRSPPNFRPDTRIRRLRSPNYRDHALEYNTGPRNNNSSPPSSRWVSYKERVFDRRSPPGRTDAPQGERFSFYDSSRKPKQNEYYRSGHPGRFSDTNEGGRGRPRYVNNDGDRPNNTGYRRGGFVKRYNMDGPTKRFYHDNEDGLGRGLDARDKQALELHARSTLNPKPCSNGTDSRFRDYPRRTREDSDVKRRSKEEKDPSVIERDSKEESEHLRDDFQQRPKDVKEQSTTNIDSMPNEVAKEDDKPTLGSN